VKKLYSWRAENKDSFAFRQTLAQWKLLVALMQTKETGANDAKYFAPTISFSKNELQHTLFYLKKIM
jgi:hypothetical protein